MASTQGIYLNIGNETRKDSNMKGDDGEDVSHTYMYILINYAGGA